MVSASHIHTINEYSVALCGFCLNALLVWLIINRSVKEMKIYTKILLQTCFIDFVLLIVIGSVQPIYIVHDGWNLILHNGPFRSIHHPWNYMMTASWLFMIHFSISTNCVPFIYRYLVICKSKVISAFQYFLMLFVCALVIAIFISLLTWSSYPHEEQRKRNFTAVIEILDMEVDPSQFQMGLMMRTRSIPWLLTSTYILTMHTISYFIIIICGLKLRKFVQCTAQSIRAQEVNRQVNKVLILQALMPMVEMSTTFVCLIISMASDSNANVYATVFATMPLHWVPLFNPLLTIWVIKPYRNFFSCFDRKNIHPASDTSQNNVNPSNGA